MLPICHAQVLGTWAMHGITSVLPTVVMCRVSTQGIEFIKAFNTEGHAKDGAYIFDRIAEAIEAVTAVSGVSKRDVVCVITDSASNCVSAGAMLEQEYGHLYRVPCAAHCLDLALEDIGKLPWVAAVVARSTEIVKFIKNHQWSLALYRRHSSSAAGKKRALLRPGKGLRAGWARGWAGLGVGLGAGLGWAQN